MQAALVASIVPYMLKTRDNPHGVEPAAFEQMARQIRHDRPQFFSNFFRDFFGVSAGSHAVSEPQLQWALMMAMQASLRATLACAQSFASTDFRSELGAFRVPTLIIHGTADQTVPVDTSARAAARGIHEAELLEYEQGPHGLFASHRQQLTQDLLRFLRD